MTIFLPSELEQLNELLFKACGVKLIDFKAEKESKEYCAHTFKLGNQVVLFRKAKVTPTKTGQFVTIWKRTSDGITAPFDVSDNFDFYIISTQTEKMSGAFIFPKEVLYANSILSGEKSKGKRGIRVYPSWDLTISKQAHKTQKWQTEYFLEIPESKKIDLIKARRLLNLLS